MFKKNQFRKFIKKTTVLNFQILDKKTCFDKFLTKK